MNTVREIQRLNEEELRRGLCAGQGASWHDQYRASAWIFVGGLPVALTEGDVICVLSQWGEVEDLNLVRDESSGKSRGFAFAKYEDQRSTVLAVDNFNGADLLGRTVRCDHVEQYRLPKHLREAEDARRDPVTGEEISKYAPGHAYVDQELDNNGFSLQRGQAVFGESGKVVHSAKDRVGIEARDQGKKAKKEKKEKKRKKRTKEEKEGRGTKDEAGVRKVKEEPMEGRREEKEKRVKKEKKAKTKKRPREVSASIRAVIPPKSMKHEDHDPGAPRRAFPGAPVVVGEDEVDGGDSGWRGRLQPRPDLPTFDEDGGKATRDAERQSWEARRHRNTGYGGQKRRR